MTIPQYILDFEDSVQGTISSICQEQEDYFNIHRKYQHSNTSINGGSLRVDEYVSPSGAGFVIWLIHGLWVKAINYGPEQRNRDWIELKGIV